MCRLWAYRLSFRSCRQLPLIMFYIEYYKNDYDREDVEFARCIWAVD